MPEQPRAKSLNQELAFELIDVHKAFGAQKVCRGVSFEVPKGKVLSILGPSGCGKTVTIKMLIGLEYPDDGSILFDGKDLATFHSEDQFLPIRQRVSMVFQGAALFDSISVYDNIAYPLRILGKPEAEIEEAIHSTLRMVGLPEAYAKMPSELSGGMKKRIGLARAIVTKPEVILYDEPTAGLDPVNTTRIIDLILKLQDHLQCTSIVITHDMVVVESVSHKVLFMDKGRVKQEGSWLDLKNSDDAQVRGFVRGDPSLLHVSGSLS